MDSSEQGQYWLSSTVMDARANIVSLNATARLYIRSLDAEYLNELVERVKGVYDRKSLEDM